MNVKHFFLSVFLTMLSLVYIYCAIWESFELILWVFTDHVYNWAPLIIGLSAFALQFTVAFGAIHEIHKYYGKE